MSYPKYIATLRAYLQGRKYYRALKALELGLKYHTGTRKDGITPEFQHQIEITLYILTLPDLLFPEETIIASLLHDLPEDYNFDMKNIVEVFGTHSADAIERVTKRKNKSREFYFSNCAEDPISSIVKGSDRIHNLKSMVGVFTKDHAKHYMKEVKEDFLPMLKTARRMFPEQHLAYENIKFVLISQIGMLEVIYKD